MSTEASIADNEQDLQAIPGPKGKFLTGNLSQIDFEKFHHFARDNAKKYGSIYRLAFAHKPVVVLSNPGTVRSILKNRPDKYRRISTMESVFSELGINGVFSTEGEQWKIQRKIMNQAFKSSQIKNYQPIIDRSTERLSNVLETIAESKKTIDVQALLQRYTVDITSNLAFGYDMDNLNNDSSELQEKINIVFPMINNRIKAPFPYWRYFKLKKDKDLNAAVDFIKKQSDQFILSAEKNINAGNQPGNILEAMIAARDEEGNSFSQEQLFPNIFTLLLAGEDTTANTLSWILHYLSLNPEYQEKLFEEINQNNNNEAEFNASNENPTRGEFSLMSAVIQECMRLMPVAPFLYLENIETENIEGYQIPAGTMIVVLLSQSGHEENYFESPDKFSPERWLSFSSNEHKQHMKNLMHFGSGARQCPGMQLSMMELKCALSMLVKNFTFCVDENAKEIQDIFAFTVMPKNLMLKISKR